MRTLLLVVVLPLAGCGAAGVAAGQVSQLAAGVAPAGIPTVPAAMPTMPAYVPCAPAAQYFATPTPPR